jgi:hypothetical protein
LNVALDKALHKEEQFQDKVRKEQERKRTEEKAAEQAGSPTPATEAATQAMLVTTGDRPLPPPRQQEAKERYEEAVHERMKMHQETEEDARKAVDEENKRKKFGIDFFDERTGVFYHPDLGKGAQVIAMINRQHPFFKTFYSKLAEAENPFPRYVVDLLLLTLAHAELFADTKETAKMYENQRSVKWSPFLKEGLDVLEDLKPTGDGQQVNDNIGADVPQDGIAPDA